MGLVLRILGILFLAGFVVFIWIGVVLILKILREFKMVIVCDDIAPDSGQEKDQ